MNILIIEDEKPAAEKLIQGIKKFDESAIISGPLESVQQAIKWFNSHPAPDIILLDIQLSDGLSFEIFKTVNIDSPLIFTTAFDDYLMDAFEFNSIDYLLKPIKQEKLEAALMKYIKLQKHFASNIQSLVQYFSEPKPRIRQRIVVQKGIDYFTTGVENIAYFFTEHKIVFLIDKEGKRYIVDKNLSDLENELDPAIFFRANRKYLVSIDSVKKFSPMEKGKIRLELFPATNEDVIVSQENGADFRKWVGK